MRSQKESHVASLKRQRDALARVLRAFVQHETEIAKTSFTEYQGPGDPNVWNDEVWQRNDPEGFALIVKARKALAAVDEGAKR